MSSKLVEAISGMNEEEAFRLVQEMLDNNVELMEILEQCRKAVELVGARYEKGEYFLPELMMTGEMLEKISELTKSRMQELGTNVEGERLGKFVIGTVKGDIHDIGKNIVTFVLDANGFEVIDLGVDVPAEKFVEAIKEHQPQILGMSALLTLAIDQMKIAVDAIEEAGLRDKVKIIIGGAPIDQQIKEHAGADGWAQNAVEAVNLAKKWIGGN